MNNRVHSIVVGIFIISAIVCMMAYFTLGMLEYIDLHNESVNGEFQKLHERITDMDQALSEAHGKLDNMMPYFIPATEYADGRQVDVIPVPMD